MIKNLFFVGVILLCTTTAKASDFSISYKWCSGSPEIKLNNVPKDTATIEFYMVDIFVPAFNHGGGTIKYTNQKIIPCGQFNATFEGPSPPPPQVHDYELTANAKDKDGKILSPAKFVRKFPEK